MRKIKRKSRVKDDPIHKPDENEAERKNSLKEVTIALA